MNKVLLYLLAPLFILTRTFSASATEPLILDEPSSKSSGIGKLLPFIGLAAGTSFFLDRAAYTFTRENQNPFVSDFIHVTDVAGEKTVVVPALLLAYAGGRFIAKDDKFTSTALKSMQAAVVSAIATESIKILVGRARPFVNEGPWSFHPIAVGRDYHKAMPSGHASLAFAIFTPFAETYSRWIYTLPALVAIGRVYQNKHWISDVTIGSSIGLLSGLLFTRHENISLIPNGIRVRF